MKSSMMTLTALLLLSACGGGGGGGGGSGIRQQEEHLPTGPVEGKYTAILRTMNPHANGFLPYGKVHVRVVGDMVEVKSYLDDDQPVMHIQSIHAGTRCPDMSADANRDGMIDFNEAIQAAKPVLIPLDGDLNSQVSGAGIYPRGRAFTYLKTASLSSLLADLTAKDDNPRDHILKVRTEEDFHFENKVVLIHGTTPNARIPSTVGSAMNLPNNETLPIACGVLKRVKTTP